MASDQGREMGPRGPASRSQSASQLAQITLVQIDHCRTFSSARAAPTIPMDTLNTEEIRRQSSWRVQAPLR